MTNGELDSLLDDLRRSTPLSRISADAARAVLLQLLAVGYDLVKPQPGSKLKLVETDAELHSIIRWLGDTTAMGALAGPEQAHIFAWLGGTGYRIQKPDRHPSNLKTTEQAHVEVKPLGRGSHTRIIDRTGMPDDAVAARFNGGESQ